MRKKFKLLKLIDFRDKSYKEPNKVALAEVKIIEVPKEKEYLPMYLYMEDDNE